MCLKLENDRVFCQVTAGHSLTTDNNPGHSLQRAGPNIFYHIAMAHQCFRYMCQYRERMTLEPWKKSTSWRLYPHGTKTFCILFPLPIVLLLKWMSIIYLQVKLSQSWVVKEMRTNYLSKSLVKGFSAERKSCIAENVKSLNYII